MSREIHFVVPKLTAHATRTFTATTVAPGAVDPDENFQWKAETGKTAELRLGDKPVLKYMHEHVDNSTEERRGETYKVYHHVFDPAGERLLTKGAGGLFPHHRGLFYGFNRISYAGKKADIWHCRNGEHQEHVAFLEIVSGAVLGRHRLVVDWHGRDDQVFAREERELTAYRTPGGTLIEFASRLAATKSTVTLDGDPQHAGFQFRATQHVPDKTKNKTYYLRPDGKGEPGSFRNWPDQADHVDLPWNALCMVVDDQRYTVCYLDHPKNPKQARFSERDYGRFGSYFEYEISPDKPLELNYRIWVQTGEMTVDEVAAHSYDFVQPPTVTVKEASS